MKIPMNMIEEATLALRKLISDWGKQVARAEGVTHREGIATVVKQITVRTGVGAAATATTVSLYAVATAEARDGTRYTKYRGDDGSYYVEDHSTGRITSV